MKILDERGRLFGFINLFDLFVFVFLLSLTPIFYFGYKILNAPRPVIESVSPNDIPGDLNPPIVTIRGRNFSKEGEVRISGEPHSFQYVSPTELAVLLREPIRAKSGWHYIQVINSWGMPGILENALQITKPLILGPAPAISQGAVVPSGPSTPMREAFNQVRPVELVVEAVTDGFPVDAFTSVSVKDTQYLWRPDLRRWVVVGEVIRAKDLRPGKDVLHLTLRLAALANFPVLAELAANKELFLTPPPAPVQDQQSSIRPAYFYWATNTVVKVGSPMVFSTPRYEVNLRVLEIAEAKGDGSRR